MVISSQADQPCESNDIKTITAESGKSRDIAGKLLGVSGGMVQQAILPAKTFGCRIVVAA